MADIANAFNSAHASAGHAPSRETVATQPTRVRPVVFRLLFVAVAAVFSIQATGAFISATRSARCAKINAQNHLSTLFSSNARLMGGPLRKQRYETVESLLEGLVTDPYVVSASVYDSAGVLIASRSAGAFSGASYPRTELVAYQDGGIRADAGRIEAQLTDAPIAAAYWTALWEGLAIAALSASAIIVALWIATHKFIGRPLALIAAAIERSQPGEGKRSRVAWDSNDELGAVVRAFNAMQDFAERSEEALVSANRRLDFLARHDPLTDLPNRRSFEDRLLRLAGPVSDEQRPCAVHIVDLDNFKEVNDTLGHAAGDKLLRHVGRQLSAAVGERGFVSRIGGDEFAVLQIEGHSEAEARAFAERLQVAVRSPLRLLDATLRTSAAIGVAMLDRQVWDIARILSLADIALYNAKRTARGSIAFLTSDMREAHERRRCTEVEIAAGLPRGEFFLYFQPQITLADGRLIGLEALVRWRHPTRGILGPGEFLTILEDMGLSSQLGGQLIVEACERARQLKQQGRGDIRIAVNLSAAQIIDPHLVDLFVEQLAKANIAGDALEVEITEGTLIRHLAEAQEVLSRLRELGMTVALDDFGTGYSSLAYIRRFPIDRIKLDRSFVSEFPEIVETAAIVRVVRDLAKALEIEVVAEGVERAIEAQCLLEEGIPIAQGYLFGRPKPFDDISALLAENEGVLREIA